VVSPIFSCEKKDNERKKPFSKSKRGENTRKKKRIHPKLSLTNQFFGSGENALSLFVTRKTLGGLENKKKQREKAALLSTEKQHNKTGESGEEAVVTNLDIILQSARFTEIMTTFGFDRILEGLATNEASPWKIVILSFFVLRF
jgi:hypothetical protein